MCGFSFLPTSGPSLLGSIYPVWLRTLCPTEKPFSWPGLPLTPSCPFLNIVPMTKPGRRSAMQVFFPMGGVPRHCLTTPVCVIQLTPTPAPYFLFANIKSNLSKRCLHSRRSGMIGWTPLIIVVILFTYKIFVCVCACVCTPQECVGPWRPGKGIASSESRVTVFVSSLT